jgi:hypothetical protein
VPPYTSKCVHVIFLTFLPLYSTALHRTSPLCAFNAWEHSYTWLIVSSQSGGWQMASWIVSLSATQPVAQLQHDWMILYTKMHELLNDVLSTARYTASMVGRLKDELEKAWKKDYMLRVNSSICSEEQEICRKSRSRSPACRPRYESGTPQILSTNWNKSSKMFGATELLKGQAPALYIHITTLFHLPRTYNSERN